MKHYLVFDLGASSGRAIVVSKNNNNIELHEVHRFKTKTIEVNNSLYWDIFDIFEQIKYGIIIAFETFINIEMIGIDTWGVDYGLLDKEGNLLRNPYFYRDQRTKKIIEKFSEIIPLENLYAQTGTQFKYFNTVFQLFADSRLESHLFSKADKILLMPDLIAYMLTGVKRIEVTNLSTTGLYNPLKKKIINDLEKLGISKTLFPKVIRATEAYGRLSEKIASNLLVSKIPVIATCSHDTASAILSIPMEENDVYISSGTWSLCGTLLDKPNLSNEARKANFTNEVGFNDKIRFLKNVMGLWILNRTVEEFKKQGINFTYEEIEQEAIKNNNFSSIINPDHESFENPPSMIEAINTYCKNTSQVIPEKPGEYFYCIYLSLALKYKYVFKELTEVTKKKYKRIFIVGGGSNIDYLNQLTSTVTNMVVKTGPQEATVLGNALSLMLSNNEIKHEVEGQELIFKQFASKKYYPEHNEHYQTQYEKLKQLIKGGK